MRREGRVVFADDDGGDAFGSCVAVEDVIWWEAGLLLVSKDAREVG